MKKKTMPKGVITFRTSEKEKLEALAEQEDRTVSYLVNLVVKELLARRKIGLSST